MKTTWVNKMKQKIISQFGVLSFLILSSCGQNSHMTLDAVTAPTDTTAPTANLSGGVSGVTNIALQTITVTFSEAVLSGSISSGDFNITNGVLSNLSCLPALAPTACTFDVTASGQGAVSVELPASAVQDAAGNSNDASNVIAWTYDSVGPTVSIAVEVGEPASGSSTNDSSIALMLTASESLAALVAGDFTCTNCTVSGISGSGTAWTLNVIPSGLGAVSVEVAASAVQDAAGNSNTLASNNLNWTYNNVAPAFTLAPASGAPTSGSTTNNSPIAVELSSSGAVTGLVAGDIICTACTISNFSGSASAYTFDVTPSGQGAFSVNVPSSVAEDAATNQNTASNTLSWSYDTSAPSATLAVGSGGAASGSTTNAASIPVTVVMGESVTGLIAGDFTCTNCTLSGFSGSGANYSFNVIPTSSGAVSVQLPASSAADAAGNGNTISNSLAWTFDNTAPSISSIVATSSFPAIGNTIGASTTSLSVDITFSENMASSGAGAITIADFAVINASITAVTCSSATLCTVVLDTSTSSEGSIGLSLATSPVAVIQDVVGNNLSGGMSATTWTMDTTGPTVTITTTEPNDPTLNTSIPITITFSEPVSGFDLGDIHSGPGPAINFSVVSSTVYTFTQIVSSTSSTAVSVDVWINAAVDQAGNGNSSATFSIGYGDGSSPNSYDNCNAVAVDSSNNRICVGVTYSSLSEEFGGGGDFFIMKVNSSGQRLWTRQGGLGSFGMSLPGGDTTQNEFCRAVTVDADDNIICVGTTGGSLGETNVGGSNGFILKLNSDGDLLWIKQIGAGGFGTSMPGGETGSNAIESVGIDHDTNNIIFAGYTSVSLGEAKFNEDIIVASLDSDGNLLWIKQGGSGSFGTDLQLQAPNTVTSENNYSPALFVDQSNNEFVLLVHNYNSGLNESQVSVVKIDFSGNMLWAKDLDTFSFNAGSGDGGDIETASDGSIYLTGYFRSSFEGFDRGGLIKLNNSGNQMWKKIISSNETFGSTNSQTLSFGLAIDSSENIIVGGYTAASIAEDASGNDVFFAKFNAAGDTLGYWQAGSGAMGASKNEHTAAGGVSNQECYSLAIDSFGNLICGGTSSKFIDNVYHFGGNSDIMLMTLNTSDVNYLNDLFTAFITSPNAVCTSSSTYEVQTSVGGHCDPDFSDVTTSYGTASCIGGMYSLNFIAGTGTPGDSQTFNVNSVATQGVREILSDTQSTTGLSFGACDGF